MPQRKERTEAWRVVRDLPYHAEEEPHTKLQLDLYVPHQEDGAATSTEQRPVVIYAHGGGWKRGDRKRTLLGRPNINENVGKSLASNGVVCAVISYRLSKTGLFSALFFGGSLAAITTVVLCLVFFMVSLLTALVSSAFTGTPSLEALVAMEGALLYAAGCFAVLVVLYFMLTWVMEAGHQRHGIKHPVHVLDLAHALKWVHDNVESYGGDSNNIFLSGHSAGGHLVTLLSLKPDYLEKAGHSKDLLRCVKGVISLSGVFHLGRLKKNIITRHWYLTPAFGKDPAVYREASPITWAKQRTRFPFLLLNAASDFHLHRDSTELAAVLREAGSKVTVCSVPKTNHRSIVSLIHSPKDRVTPLLLAFIFQREDQLEKMVQSSSSSPKEDEKKDKESQTKKRKKEQ